MIYRSLWGNIKVWAKRLLIALIGASIAGTYAYILWLQNDTNRLEEQKVQLEQRANLLSQRLEQVEAENELLKGVPLR